ncbi:MAG: hypothetical protein PHW73_14235 [Atribacterota bacterium]|nr:hypothetical protein [Atribacterota bacterium]
MKKTKPNYPIEVLDNTFSILEILLHLKAGGSIIFNSNIPLRTVNKTKKNVRAVWINSKAWAFSTKYQRFKYDINRKEKKNG